MEKIEILKILIDLSEKEADRWLSRYSTWLYADTGLLVILPLILDTRLFIAVLLPALLGVAISISWLMVNNASYFYQNRWHADVEALIKSDENLSEWIRGRTNPRIARPFKKLGGKRLFDIVPTCFLILWGALLITAILGLVWQPFGAFLIQTLQSK